MPLRATAGMEGQREKKVTPGRKGPCGLLRRDYGILGEKKIRGHSGGNDWQGLTAGGGTYWREDSGGEGVVRRV